MNFLSKAAEAVRNNRVLAGVMGLSLSVSAMADTSTIDTSGVTGLIQGDGLTALGLIGAAWLIFRYTKKVWNRI